MNKIQKNKAASGAAKPINLSAESRSTKRIRGLRRRFIGIDAVVDPDSGEILRTYDPGTGELLLNFPPGVFPDDIERRYADVYSSRDFRMEFQHGGTPAAVQSCAEKLVAYAVMRDFAGLPCRDLVLTVTGGFCGSMGRYVNAEHAVLMSLAGVSWSARNGKLPTYAELEIPDQILSESTDADATSDRERLSVPEVFKWRMSEAVQVLNRYSKFIRMLGRVLAGSGKIGALQLEMFLRCKGGLANS
jgi:hypothetical protein